MKSSYLTKRIVVAALAICLFALTTVGVSLAYYTDTSNASGSVPFATSPGTEIEEKFDGNKHVTIKNTGDVPVVVRLKVNPSEKDELFTNSFAKISVGSTSNNWVRLSSDNEWIYYAQPLMAGASTDRLDVNVKPSDDAPSSFDITVFQQHGVAYYQDGALCAKFGDSVISLTEGTFAPVGAASNL